MKVNLVQCRTPTFFKYLLFSFHRRKSHRFGVAWGSINRQNVYFWVDYPSKMSSVFCLWFYFRVCVLWVDLKWKIWLVSCCISVLSTGISAVGCFCHTVAGLIMFSPHIWLMCFVIKTFEGFRLIHLSQKSTQWLD